MANKDLPIAVQIVGGVVTITMGVTTMCGAVAAGRSFPSQAFFTDEYAFARAVTAALVREDETATTPVHRMLDDAAAAAIEQRADGIHLPPGDA